MKKLLIFIFIFISTQAWADCVGTVTNVESDSNGNVLIDSSYVVDGIAEQNIDRQTYTPTQLKGLSDKQIQDKITTSMNNICSAIIRNKYKVVTGKDAVIENTSNVATPILNNLKNNLINLQKINVDITESIIQIDSDGDGQYDQEWHLHTDGTKDIVNIIPVPIPN